jgi:hypothetical protein
MIQLSNSSLEADTDHVGMCDPRTRSTSTVDSDTIGSRWRPEGIG